MSEWAALITAIGGLGALLGPIVTLLLFLRRISPNERRDAAQAGAETTDQAQDRKIRELEELLAHLQEPPAEES